MFSVTSSIPMSPDKKEKQNSFHVAWKDRIGFSDRWKITLDKLEKTWGTDEFSLRLDFLIYSIVNIKDGPELFDLIQEKRDELYQCVEYNIEKYIMKHPEIAEEKSKIDYERKLLNNKASILLYHFVIQTLEDKNLGFYRSGYIGEYDEIK